ncbi:MAG: glycosyltransferase family 2 protein [Oscillospiraceae bacterium]|nr:glycosyltransferase family 2 protein [Oscillospiraceae bacterium]
MLQFVRTFNMVIFWVITLTYLYQIVYLVVGLIARNKKSNYVPKKLHRYAAIIAARNEEAVIGELLKTLCAQKYPKHLLDLYVIADNCTDATADVARANGATVVIRNDLQKIGKGYALDYFFHQLEETYDGYFVFDADNLVDENFVMEMNRVFDQGYAAVTSYRNSKNYDSNWLTAGYSLWFLREACFLNHPRMLLGTNCAISGTGFLISHKLIEKHGGWPFHLLTEDIEFSVNCAVDGDRIGYAGGAVLYDEQPASFRQSWNQRLRWSKGFYQVITKYCWKLIGGILRGKRNAFSCFDMLMTVAPSIMLTFVCIAVNLFVLLTYAMEPFTWDAIRLYEETINSLWTTVRNFYLVLLMYGGLTLLSEWKVIRCPAWKKLLYVFAFPVFLLTYVPISIAALFQKVEWKPIKHSVNKTMDDMKE